MHSFVFSYQLSAMIKITEHSSVLNFYLDRIVLRSRPRLLKMHLLNLLKWLHFYKGCIYVGLRDRV